MSSLNDEIGLKIKNHKHDDSTVEKKNQETWHSIKNDGDLSYLYNSGNEEKKEISIQRIPLINMREHSDWREVVEEMEAAGIQS